MSGTAKPRLVVFAKAPRMGAAKTRLARDVGAVAAQRHYRALTARTLRRVRDGRWQLELRVTPDGARLPLWRGARISDQAIVDQGRGGLSERLGRAMAGPRPVCVIGTDAPEVRAADIAEAFRALRRAELVLGPATDGGFWLIAARGPVPGALFADVRWSGPNAAADVAAQAGHLLGRVAWLRELADVDDGEALRAWRQRKRLARHLPLA